GSGHLDRRAGQGTYGQQSHQHQEKRAYRFPNHRHCQRPDCAATLPATCQCFVKLLVELAAMHICRNGWLVWTINQDERLSWPARSAGHTRGQATFVKSGGRRSAKAMNASRASAVRRRCANCSPSAVICATSASPLRISRLVAISAPAG